MGNSAPHFKVHTFEGPLDLLLQLIEEEKLPINEIAIASVTEQFLEHLKRVETKQPEILADFLVVAAKLLVIKSHALLPTLELPPEEEEAAADLAAQLLNLKRYREVAKYLKDLDNRRKQSFTREPFMNEQVIFYPDREVTTKTLNEAAKKLLEALQSIAKLPQTSVAEVISISEKISQLQNLISEKVQVALQDLLKSSKTKTEAIVTFLALLELIKQRILTVEQETLFADIIVKRKH